MAVIVVVSELEEVLGPLAPRDGAQPRRAARRALRRRGDRPRRHGARDDLSGELRMLTRVARMYHEEGLPQREIAARLSLSQSRVSRLLRHAADVGIVRTVVVPAARGPRRARGRAARGLRAARRGRRRRRLAAGAAPPPTGRDVSPGERSASPAARRDPPRRAAAQRCGSRARRAPRHADGRPRHGACRLHRTVRRRVARARGHPARRRHRRSRRAVPRHGSHRAAGGAHRRPRRPAPRARACCAARRCATRSSRPRRRRRDGRAGTS